MNGLQNTSGAAPQHLRVDFDKSGFDDLIAQKGNRVCIESALVCPCKGQSTNQQSNCKNCGGTGWIYVNKRETRMILQKINLVNDFAPWSEENRGWVNISFNSHENLAFMDKITKIDGRSEFSEVLFFKKATDTTLFTYTVYPIKEIIYVGLFIDVNTPLLQLEINVDYTFENNVIRIINPSLVQSVIEDTSLTIRYRHAPIFYLMEMKRDSMETFEFVNGGEVLKHMPLSAVARRAHYVLNAENLAGNRLLNNDFISGECKQKECQVRTIGNRYDFAITQGDTFDYSLSINENGVPVDISARTYIMQVRDNSNNLITEFTVGNGGIFIQLPNIVFLSKSASDTASLPFGSYSYDMQETIGSNVTTILAGRFTVIKQITT